MAFSVLLYDGTCRFCNWTVQFVLRHERKDTLRFAALRSAYGAEVRKRHAALEGIDSVVWLEPASGEQPERAFVRSAAALRVARYLGGPWRLALLGYLIPRGLRDQLYSLFARHRHRLLGSAEQCVVPPPAARFRFLDQA